MSPQVVDPYSWAGRLACATEHLTPLIAQAREAGELPEVGTPEWTAAEPMAKYAAVFVALLGHWDAYAFRGLVSARDRRERPLRVQREASYEISAALDWAAESRRPSHVELERRRAEVVVPQ